MDRVVGWSSVSAPKWWPGPSKGNEWGHPPFRRSSSHRAGGSMTRELCFALVSAGGTAVNSI